MSPSSPPPCTQSSLPPSPHRSDQVCQLFPELVGQLRRVSVERISATTRIAISRNWENSVAGATAAKEAASEQVVSSSQY